MRSKWCGLVLACFLFHPGLALADEPSESASQTEPARAPTAAPVKKEEKAEPFAFADFTWLNGNSRQKYSVLDSKYFTGEFLLDANYTYSFANPVDHTIDGACEVARSNELQVQQLGVGGDFHYENVRGRFLTQFGMYSQMTPRNDGSPARGQWDLADAYRYLSEAYGGYHLDVWNGINIDAGIFMSYVGLFSYYQFENWAYTPSYVSANTPWFFNGIRVQTFPSDRLKIEYWLINGWQSYGMFNNAPGLGTQILWRPTGDLEILSNDYYGYDTMGNPSRMRVHSDNSFLYKYYDKPANTLDKMALSATFDIGCESGGGVNCVGDNGVPAQNFVGFMLYNRFWFNNDLFGLTVGGGAITNPGRYLVLLPPINGATAASGTNYFPTTPGTPFQAWDGSITFDYMPNQFITFRFEINHREANVPYFAGPGGMTPTPSLTNQGAPGSTVNGWSPDLRPAEDRVTAAMLVRL